MSNLTQQTDIPEGARAPKWVMLIPAPVNGTVAGRDGRTWKMASPEAVVRRSLDRGLMLPFDWEHATEIKSPKGERSPAAGWITDLQARNGAVWGAVSWTDDGAKDVVGKTYRYVSPVFTATPSRDIQRIVSAALVHTPNLDMPHLNRQQTERLMTFPVEIQTERLTTIPVAIPRALGLSDDADEAQCCAAIDKLKAEVAREANRADRPSITSFVPRSDHDQLEERALNAERQVQELKGAAHQEKVDVAINSALRAGKITPATEGYHRASCATTEGLAAFVEYARVAPSIVPASGLDGKIPEHKAGTLPDEAREICRQLGLSPTTLLG